MRENDLPTIGLGSVCGNQPGKRLRSDEIVRSSDGGSRKQRRALDANRDRKNRVRRPF